ncbi:MAG: energy-coupling factor transporter transmembrane protein EcfT [Atopobiaceae bacterium]|nr:energy-coupling factor transporter transmembrane protein EcfT [Atopobiaceae bacterium]
MEDPHTQQSSHAQQSSRAKQDSRAQQDSRTERHSHAQQQTRELPSWLAAEQDYEPQTDRSSFVQKSALSIAAVLRQLRLDDGTSARFSPSAPLKLVLLVLALVANSLSRNLMVTLILLACVLVRALFLNRSALARVVAVSLGAAGLAFIISLPAILLGQSTSAVRLGVKALVSTGLAMEVALTTPASQLTGALRSFKVPNLVIMTIDLTLRNIVLLGERALETLIALNLRSVGKDSDKRSSIGGVGGTLFIRASVSAQDTYDAMVCRGFDGTYDPTSRTTFRRIDLLWVGSTILLALLFLHLEGILFA